MKLVMKLMGLMLVVAPKKITRMLISTVIAKSKGEIMAVNANSKNTGDNKRIGHITIIAKRKGKIVLPNEPYFSLRHISELINID